ncbi:MAG: lysophospholipid acyltransferase family protein [Chloroflexi bacterium]|nr:lysophospholipid acyltransferase family protein [Chloroflexota bacterium]
MWRQTIALANRLNLTYWIIVSLSFLAHVLPLRISYAITVALSYVIYICWPALRKCVMANMRQVLGDDADEATVRALTRSAYRNYFKYLVDFLRFPHLSKRELEGVIKSSGWEHLDKALESGKGVIFVGFHFGNWDLAGAMLALRGYPLNVVAESFQPAKLNDLIQRYRIEKGMKIIPLEIAARKVLRALRQNEILGLLIDRPEPASGVPVEFFDRTASVPGGAATLAVKTGAKIVLGYLVRLPDNTFSGLISPHLDFEPTGDFAQDVQLVTQKIMDIVEECIRQYPDQWYMFQHMWGDNQTATSSSFA